MSSIPGEDATAVAAVATCATGLQMSLEIRLDCISLEAFVTFPLLLGAVLPSIVFLDANKVAQSMRGVVMKARPLRTNVDTLVISQTGPFQ